MASAGSPFPKNAGSVRQAAERYAVSTDTIRRRIADGTLTAYRIGPRTLRIDLDQAAAVFGVVNAADVGRH